jgi:hypothetical protein
MAEINKPNQRTFWRVTSTGVKHEGLTEIDQVTTAPNIYTLTSNVSTTALFSALPTSGEVKVGEIYSYNGGMVQVVQTHTRTIFAPEETPALFNVYRANTKDAAWIAQEKVIAGDERFFKDKYYMCIQTHTTQVDWPPDKTPALWKEMILVVDIPVWVRPTGAHDAYKKGDKVHFPTINDPVYESLIDANVTVPTDDIPWNRYWRPAK